MQQELPRFSADINTELIAFSENVLGGIQTFYLNLLSQLNECDFKIKWLLIDHSKEIRAKAPNYHFPNIKIPYNSRDGKWRRALKLSKHITKGPGLILANREFELESLSLYPCTDKTVYYIVHDDYYLQFSTSYQQIIDVYICHNTFIYDELVRLLPSRIADIHFLPFGVRLSPFTRSQNLSLPLSIAFIARLDIAKGIHHLTKIDDLLKDWGVSVNWLVFGDGSERENFLASIEEHRNFKHLLAKDDNEIFEEIKKCDLFILPSVHDGTPVALLESMSVGLVPLLYEFNKGIKDVVTDEIGYVVPKNDFRRLAEIIQSLNGDRVMLEQKSRAALQLAKSRYDVVKATKEYSDLFKSFTSQKKVRSYSPPKPKSIFDQTWMPEKVVTTLRIAVGVIRGRQIIRKK